MELLTKRKVAAVVAGVTAIALLGACSKGHPETDPAAKNPGVSADGGSPVVDPTTGSASPSVAPTESSDGTGDTGDPNQIPSGTEGAKQGPRNPLIFVLGDRAGSTAIFGCMQDGGKIYTFGTDSIEGRIKGGTVTEKGVTKPTGDQTPTALQHEAAAHPDQLLTGSQRIGGSTVDCGHPIDLSTTPLYDESGPVTVGQLQAYQPLAEHTDGTGFSVLATGHA